MTAKRSGGAVPSLSLLLLLLLLLAAADVRSDVFDDVNGTRLAAAADDFLRHWTARDGRVRMRLRPDRGESDGTECGYQFTATTADGRSVAHPLPPAATVLCDGADEYRVHLSAAADAAAGYDATVDLGAADGRVAVVRLEAAGVTAAPLTDLCFGFRDAADAAGPFVFCADVELLMACRRWTESPDVDFGTARVQLKAGRPYSCREIVFHDVRALARGFQSLVRSTADPEARRSVCERIGFGGAEQRRLEGCLGRLVGARAPSDPADGRQFKHARGGSVVDVDDAYGRCEFTNSTAPPPAANDGGGGDGRRTPSSGGRTLNTSDAVFASLLLLPVVCFVLGAVVVADG